MSTRCRFQDPIIRQFVDVDIVVGKMSLFRIWTATKCFGRVALSICERWGMTYLRRGLTTVHLKRALGKFEALVRKVNRGSARAIRQAIVLSNA